MEGAPENKESFESFKSRIEEIYKAEGISDNLNSIIKEWEDKGYEFTDRYGSTLEERISFKMELGQVYAVIGKYDNVYDILIGAWDMLDGMGLVQERQKVEDLMNTLLDRK